MSDELYLILHKVRGEATFDVASKCMIGKDEGWIIPTSGHRAYPAASWPLNRLEMQIFDGESDLMTNPTAIAEEFGDLSDLPDHYDAKRDDGSHLVNAARDILLKKGLISHAKPAQPAYRRV